MAIADTDKVSDNFLAGLDAIEAGGSMLQDAQPRDVQDRVQQSVFLKCLCSGVDRFAFFHFVVYHVSLQRCRPLYVLSICTFSSIVALRPRICAHDKCSEDGSQSLSGGEGDTQVLL